MAYKAQQVEMSYQMAKMLPDSDSTSMTYNDFKKTFGEDGSILFIGIQSERFFELDVFHDLEKLGDDLRSINGVKSVLSLPDMYELKKNDSLHSFELKAVMQRSPESQKELDSIRDIMTSQPFYEGLLINNESLTTLMTVSFRKEMLNTRERVHTVEAIKAFGEAFSSKHHIDLHYSGLPYIRTMTSEKIQKELFVFVLLAMLIASLALLIFFRSFKAVIYPMLIVLISVIWALGIISILEYKITILTSIIPPLLIIIGVENCIFLLNKYHHEYKNHGNKVKALSRVVQRVGNATFLTNLTTATGFAAFIVTGNKILVEFGIVASIGIMIIFILSIILIPSFYSYLPPPEDRHTNHLDRNLTNNILNKIIYLVENKRKYIYIISGIFVLFAFYGMSKLKTSGNVVDDIPQKDPMYQDIMFFEKEFKGILPFEISIDTKKNRGYCRLSTLKKIDQLQDSLACYPEFSRPLSIVEVVKLARQAFYNGNPEYYSLPNSQEKNFILSYMPSMKGGQKNIINSLIDTNMRITRLSVNMANIGTRDIQRIKDDLVPKINAIFPTDKYDVEITGTSVVFLKGSDYMVKNLFYSLLLAIFAISILMALLFTSAKMVMVSLIPNILPQILTAALMGFFAIHIKTSTILIFSVALGISVDNAIHFLSRYRMELKANNWNIRTSVITALHETGYSMIYSSIVLFFGFAIFTMSGFGGLQSMGFLVSFTLVVAVLSNLFVLPSLLLSLHRRITTKTFKEPLLEIFDEEEDIELDELEIEEPDTRGSA